MQRAYTHFVTKKQVDGFKFTAYSDASVKKALSELFQGFCAYCESYYDATQTQDVEHFRPKGRVDNGTAKTKPGYWWLAAEWTNLVPSCILCNRETNQLLFDGTIFKTGKGDRFPLLDESKRAKEQGQEVREVPLLIDPCADDPTEFLTYAVLDGKCIVVPRTANETDLRYKRARASIDVYGLNRAKLVLDRTRYMMRISISLRQLQRSIRQLNHAQEATILDIEGSISDELEYLAMHMRAEDRFSAMSRWLIEPVLNRLDISL
ncbi:MAG: retron system putative HNH endonuclease [Phyllobacterium sp.]|uniref:retron system putative HNH endonuclease n=1 Tax=Phyllobacterium sp. TaxID=1871046 RepID=UPI0030F2DEB6